MSARSWGVRAGGLVRALSYALVLSGCLIEDHKCGKNQRVSEGTLLTCQCDTGYVLGPDKYTCVPCGENAEPATDGTCACKAGFARQSASAPCTAVPGGYPGKPCSDAEPCGEPVPYCAETEGAAYCTTTGCTRNADCPRDWRCRRMGELSFCALPPSGLGKACASQADCQGLEADYCEIVAAHACLINDCIANPTDCPSGSVCCDLTRLAGQSLCVIESVLTDGACPGGAAPVTQ